MFTKNRFGSSSSSSRRSTRNTRLPGRQHHALEPLEARRLYSAVSAVALGGVLTVIGGKHDDVITVSRDPAGNLLVNGGDVKIKGQAATVASIGLINLFGLDGNDSLTIDETNGQLPVA